MFAEADQIGIGDEPPVIVIEYAFIILLIYVASKTTGTFSKISCVPWKITINIIYEQSDRS